MMNVSVPFDAVGGVAPSGSAPNVPPSFDTPIVAASDAGSFPKPPPPPEDCELAEQPLMAMIAIEKRPAERRPRKGWLMAFLADCRSGAGADAEKSARGDVRSVPH